MDQSRAGDRSGLGTGPNQVDSSRHGVALKFIPLSWKVRLDGLAAKDGVTTRLGIKSKELEVRRKPCQGQAR